MGKPCYLIAFSTLENAFQKKIVFRKKNANFFGGAIHCDGPQARRNHQAVQTMPGSW